MTADPVADLRARAKPWPRGNRFEDFTVGRVFRHHWGRTLTVGDNTLFATLTLHYNPLYTNLDYARAHGYAAAGGAVSDALAGTPPSAITARRTAPASGSSSS